MLTLLCEYLRNWFDEGCNKVMGKITIAGGAISVRNTPITVQNGQYFRIIGSVFNDGVHQFPDYNMSDEEFDGAVWEMKVPNEVVALAEDISKWCEKYGAFDSPAMSPFNSESFAGYSYSKGTGASGPDGNESSNSWQSVFKSRLNMWRKL